MIRITTDRAIREKIEEIRERDFEKRIINERFEHMEERLCKLEHEIDELRWGKLSEGKLSEVEVVDEEELHDRPSCCIEHNVYGATCDNCEFGEVEE